MQSALRMERKNPQGLRLRKGGEGAVGMVGILGGVLQGEGVQS